LRLCGGGGVCACARAHQQKAEISEKNLIRIDRPVLNRIDRTAMHFISRVTSLPSTLDWPVRSLDPAGLPTHGNFLSKSRLEDAKRKQD